MANSICFIDKEKQFCEEFSVEKAKELIDKKKMFWIDLIRPEVKEIEPLQELLKIHPLTTEDMTKFGTRIKVEEFPDYAFMVFYGINPDYSMYEIDFILGKNFLVSTHKKEDPFSEKLKKNPEKLASLLKKGPDFLMHEILDMEIDNFFPVLDSIDDLIEAQEKIILKNPESKTLEKIIKTKNKINKIRKKAFHQREKLMILTKRVDGFFSNEAIPFFRDLYDSSIRITDLLDNYRENLSSLVEIHMSVISNRMNEVMKVLSVIATIMLPLTVITGMYGMNFKLLPFAEWEHGFTAMLGIMLALMVTMLWFFKKRNWF
ncbi:MAG: magnesium/cobalt transporter CorA [Candidatus Diapherotrites archaeon]